MRKRSAALVLVVLAACGRPPVTDEVTVQFSDEDDTAVITAETKFDLSSRNPRVEAARNAALAGTDPWTVRFARLTPELDRVTFERNRGDLARVVHTVRVPADDLQRVFSDTSVTVLLTRADGWNELTLLPGASTRATREQERHFEEHLRSWSGDVARYFRAIDHLYDYLDENPHRAEAMFAALVASKEEDPLVTEEELPFLEAVMHAMERIAARMDATEGAAFTFGEVADLIYNPFPAKMTFRAPGAKDLVIEPVDLYGAIAALEGKWISPDPLAALLRNDIPPASELAAMPRKSAAAPDASEIAAAIKEQLARPKSYTLRWRE